MKKNKEKSALTLVSLLGIVLCIVVYMFVYSSYNKKTDELKTQNASLQARINELEQYYINRKSYEDGIVEMTQDIQAKLDVFPADSRSEDAIALALSAWDKWILVQYKALAIEDKENVGTITGDVMQRAKIEGLDQDINFYNRSVAYSNTTTYSEMKELISAFNEAGEKASLESVTYSVDNQTGLLSGVITVAFHSATGTGKEYVMPKFGDYSAGLSSLFVQPSDPGVLDELKNPSGTVTDATATEESDEAVSE